MNNCSNSSQQRVVCEVHYRTFSRESDKKRHKCTNERWKPVSQQMGAVQCTNCNRWFHSKGGLSVHPGHAYFVSSLHCFRCNFEKYFWHKSTKNTLRKKVHSDLLDEAIYHQRHHYTNIRNTGTGQHNL